MNPSFTTAHPFIGQYVHQKPISASKVHKRLQVSDVVLFSLLGPQHLHSTDSKPSHSFCLFTLTVCDTWDSDTARCWLNWFIGFGTFTTLKLIDLTLPTWPTSNTFNIRINKNGISRKIKRKKRKKNTQLASLYSNQINSLTANPFSKPYLVSPSDLLFHPQQNAPARFLQDTKCHLRATQYTFKTLLKSWKCKTHQKICSYGNVFIHKLLWVCHLRPNL